eukprot:g4328.t1
MGSTAIFKSIYRIYFCLNGKAPGCGLRVLRPAYEFYLTDEWLYAFDHTRLKKEVLQAKLRASRADSVPSEETKSTKTKSVRLQDPAFAAPGPARGGQAWARYKGCLIKSGVTKDAMRTASAGEALTEAQRTSRLERAPQVEQGLQLREDFPQASVTLVDVSEVLIAKLKDSGRSPTPLSMCTATRPEDLHADDPRVTCILGDCRAQNEARCGQNVQTQAVTLSERNLQDWRARWPLLWTRVLWMLSMMRQKRPGCFGALALS